MEFSERLKTERKRNGLTLESLSSDASISKSYLWELENKDSEPSLAIAKRLAIKLGVSLDYISGYSDDRGALSDYTKFELLNELIKREKV